MTLDELARRLSATTLFSPLGPARLRALLGDSPRRQAGAGDWLADSLDGQGSHIVLLAGGVEAVRSWISADGTACSQARRIAVPDDGPGFALISAAGHRYRVQAGTDVDYVSIDSHRLEDLLGWGHLGAFLLPEPHLKVFHRLPLENVARAIDCLIERAVAPGETIVTQGEPGDGYYILLAGEAEVRETDPDTGLSTLVNRLVDGDGFGEEALLTDSHRTATVTMTTPGAVLVLSKPDFEALLSPPLVAEIDAGLARQMLALGTARLLDCRHPAEHEDSRIPGALLVPLDSLRHDGVFALETGLLHIVCCGTGRRSRAAAFLLSERGIPARCLAGGLAAWPYELEGAAV